MKSSNKLIGILLAVMVLFSVFTIINKDSSLLERVEGKKDFDKVKVIYRDYLDRFYDENLGDVILVDLDFDGVPEMLGGELAMTSSPVELAASIKNGRLRELDFKVDKKGSYVGLWTFFPIRLYQNKDTKEHVLIGKDISIRSYEYQQEVECEIKMEGSTVVAKEIFYYSFDDEDKQSKFTYRHKGREVTKGDYEDKRKEYYRNLEEIYLKTYTNDRHSSQSSIDDFLEEGLKAFR